jgi:hypothetical protein
MIVRVSGTSRDQKRFMNFSGASDQRTSKQYTRASTGASKSCETVGKLAASHRLAFIISSVPLFLALHSNAIR